MNLERRIKWIQDKAKEYGADGVALTLGYDVESAVLAYLAQQAFPDNSLVVWAGTQTPHKRHFLRNVEYSGIGYKWVNVEYGLNFVKMVKTTFELSNPYKDRESMEKYFYEQETEIDRSYKQNPEIDQIIGDMKARWKATVLRAHAKLNNYLVMSSLNRSKYETGLFTRCGEDVGCIAPIIDLTHTEIIELAREIGISELVINEVPTRGYYEGQTDEGEMGVTYDILDKYIKGEEVSTDDKNKIISLSKNSEVKKRQVDLMDKFE